jgi:hypothetical protein
MDVRTMTDPKCPKKEALDELTAQAQEMGLYESLAPKCPACHISMDYLGLYSYRCTNCSERDPNLMIKKFYPDFTFGPIPHWIYIEDKLPEEGQDILMSYNNFVMEGKFVRGKFYHPSSCPCVEEYCHCEKEQEGISHWMPLPEPPHE